MIQTADLRFGYSSEAVLFSSLNLDFPAGTITFVTGPSGCGKSTLLYLLGQMLSPTGGDVAIGGVSTSRLGDADRARLRRTVIGFVFQDAMLDSARSILDNVVESTVFGGISRRAAKRRAVELLGNVGLDLDIDRRAVHVSGGQAQRIALCRALVQDPEVVLADEPTGNLDSKAAADVVGELRREAASGRCVIVVTHDRRAFGRSDRVINL